MTYNNTKVTVIIPVYQSEKYLKDCLESLINQDFKERYQLVLVDLGSTDSSSSICDAYERKYPELIFRIHTFPNLGVSMSRNIGLFVSLSDYITFVDADDFVKPNYLSYLYKEIVKGDYDILTAGNYLYKKKATLDYSRINLTTTGKRALLKLYKSPFMKIRTFTWGRIYKTSFLKEHRLSFSFELERFEDWAFFSLALYYANKVKFVKKPLYYYRDNPTSSMHQKADMVTPFLNALKIVKTSLIKEDKDFANKLFDKPSLAIKLQLKHFSKMSQDFLKEDVSEIYQQALTRLIDIYSKEE